MNRILAVLIPVLILVPSLASARVFSFKDARLAAFIRGTGGLSSVGQDPFATSSGTDTTIDGETKYQYSGELGLAIGFGDRTNVRFGVEAIQHRPVSQAKGLNPAGQERFELESDVFVFNPNVTLEYVFSSAGNFRLYGMAGVGMADVTVENHYKMTALGTTDYSVGDFDEKMQGSGIESHFGGGFEVLFTDNVTFSADAYYRYLKIQTLKYKGDANTIVSNTGVAKGDVVLNQDGNKRALDLGGLVFGFTFKFYLNFL